MEYKRVVLSWCFLGFGEDVFFVGGEKRRRRERGHKVKQISSSLIFV